MLLTWFEKIRFHLVQDKGKIKTKYGRRNKKYKKYEVKNIISREN